MGYPPKAENKSYDQVIIEIIAEHQTQIERLEKQIDTLGLTVKSMLETLTGQSL